MKDKFLEVIKNKWLRSVSLTLVLVAIIVCAYIAVNYGIKLLNISDIDMTKEKLFSISQETKDKLGSLEKDVTINVYQMPTYIIDLSYKYQNLNNHIKVNEVEDLTSKTNWKTEYGITTTTPAIIIEAEGKERVLFEYDLYTYDYNSYKTIDITEEAITNAILGLIIQEKPVVYFMTGHNMYSDNYFSYIQQAITEEANEVKTVDLLTSGKVPDDCDALIITTILEDIKEAEKNYLIDYMKKGGRILLLTDPNLTGKEFKNFNAFLTEYGISSISEGIILEGDTSRMIQGSPSIVVVPVNSSSSIVKNANMSINVCLMDSTKINFAESNILEEKNVTVEYLASVSEKAFLRTDLENKSTSKIEEDEDASGATVGAILNKKIDDNTTSKLIVFGNSIFATNYPIQVNSQSYSYALDFYNNKDVLLNSISYLTEREDTITIRKGEEAVTFNVTETQARIILGIIFAMPVFIVLVGILVWILRRRKK